MSRRNIWKYEKKNIFVLVLRKCKWNCNHFLFKCRILEWKENFLSSSFFWAIKIVSGIFSICHLWIYVLQYYFVAGNWLPGCVWGVATIFFLLKIFLKWKNFKLNLNFLLKLQIIKHLIKKVSNILRLITL